MEFLKSNDVSLNPAGYLVSTLTSKPVNHKEFVEQQKTAHYIVKLSEAVVGKNFKATKVDDFDAIARQVQADINAADVKNYVTAPSKPTSKVNDEIVQFALDYAAYGDEKEKVERINTFMQKFNAINAIEEVGDYFQEGLVKLNKIYTIAEVLEAVKINIDKL
jgi:enolase